VGRGGGLTCAYRLPGLLSGVGIFRSKIAERESLRIPPGVAGNSRFLFLRAGRKKKRVALWGVTQGKVALRRRRVKSAKERNRGKEIRKEKVLKIGAGGILVDQKGFSKEMPSQMRKEKDRPSCPRLFVPGSLEGRRP